MGDLVIREDRNGAATLFINRPEKLNALNIDLFAMLEAHVDTIVSQIETVGLVIVRGAGRCFSAGNDLSDIAAGRSLPRPNFQGQIIEKLANLPQPV
jgi:enoyl-CoA hydratase